MGHVAKYRHDPSRVRKPVSQVGTLFYSLMRGDINTFKSVDVLIADLGVTKPYCWKDGFGKTRQANMTLVEIAQLKSDPAFLNHIYASVSRKLSSKINDLKKAPYFSIQSLLVEQLMLALDCKQPDHVVGFYYGQILKAQNVMSAFNTRLNSIVSRANFRDMDHDTLANMLSDVFQGKDELSSIQSYYPIFMGTNVWDGIELSLLNIFEQFAKVNRLFGLAEKNPQLRA